MHHINFVVQMSVVTRCLMFKYSVVFYIIHTDFTCGISGASTYFLHLHTLFILLCNYKCLQWKKVHFLTGTLVSHMATVLWSHEHCTYSSRGCARRYSRVSDRFFDTRQYRKSSSIARTSSSTSKSLRGRSKNEFCSLKITKTKKLLESGLVCETPN